MKTKKFIYVTFQRPGFHCYPGAPKDVSYLSSMHRHLFKFKIHVEVNERGREIEFHQFLNWIESQVGSSIQLNNKSCEMLSEDLIKLISAEYPLKDIIVDISEDGECGSLEYYYAS